MPKIENSILLFHSPYCGGCSLVHKPLEKASLSLGIDFIEVPVKFGKPLDKAIQHGFILASYEGKGSQFSRQLMKQVRRSAGRKPSDVADIEKILQANGVDSSKLFAERVARDVASMNELVDQYQIYTTPSIYVSGNKKINLRTLTSVKDLKQLIKHLHQSEQGFKGGS